MKGNLSVLETR